MTMTPPDDGSRFPRTHEPRIASEKLSLKARVREKTKRLLSKPLPEEASAGGPHQALLVELDDDPAFNSSKFLNRRSIGPSGFFGKTIDGLQKTAETIVHPKSAVKQRATKTTAGKLAKSHPYLSRRADLDFLDAHDELQRAQDLQGSSHGEEASSSDIDALQSRMDDMEWRRKSMRVAWITERHVQRVRVIQFEPPPFPDDTYFEEMDDCGYQTFNWTKWIGHYTDDSDMLPFDEDTLRRQIERLIIVSAPLQAFISDVRCVYRWEHPARTGRWLLLYVFLWRISHIMTFVYAFIFYSTVMNYLYPDSVAELRSGMERSIDRSSTAFKVEELMNKHGSDDWLGELMEQAGPQLQLQMADFISLLEACYNFYHFQSPKQTRNTLCLIAAWFLLTAFTDSRFMLKVFWFLLGVYFFLCWPISSLHPRYRLLVSPWKWALWNIPNHAEWCFRYLQDRAASVNEAFSSNINNDVGVHFVGEQKSNTDDQDDDRSDIESFYSTHDERVPDNGRDILRFFCTYRTAPGHFIVSTTGIRFMPIVDHILTRHQFYYPYSDLVEMSKRQTRSSILSPMVNATSSLDKLDLRLQSPDPSSPLPG